jgi:uncharacterized membrane protein
VPAEFVAGLIATFVSPPNRMVCCIWMAEQRSIGPRAMDLASYGIEASEVDPVSASQLFALICLLSQEDESTHVRQKFLARMKKTQKEAMA